MGPIGHRYRLLIRIENYGEVLNFRKAGKENSARNVLSSSKRQIVSAFGQFAPMEIQI